MTTEKKKGREMAKIKKGDRVNYHALINGPVTSTGHTVLEEPWELEQGRHDRRRKPTVVTMISDKRGWVAVEALSLAEVEAGIGLRRKTLAELKSGR